MTWLHGRFTKVGAFLRADQCVVRVMSESSASESRARTGATSPWLAILEPSTGNTVLICRDRPRWPWSVFAPQVSVVVADGSASRTPCAPTDLGRASLWRAGLGFVASLAMMLLVILAVGSWQSRGSLAADVDLGLRGALSWAD